MKITIITNYWKKSDGGGVKVFLVNLVDALKNQNIDVNVIFRIGYDPEQVLGNRSKFGFSLSCYWQLRKIQPEVIHSHGPWYCLFPGVIYKKFHGCRLVHTFHTEPDRRLWLPEKIIFQRLLNSCDYVTFVSKRLEEKHVEFDGFSFPRSAITYAGVRGVDVSDEEVELFRKQHGIDKNSIVLLSIGMTVLPYKAEGLKLLIRAVKILREIYPNLILVATREGRYSEELKKFAHKTGVEDLVIFTGDVENPSIPLKLCSIYTHTVLGEGGVSIALLEAMAMGKPIIATPFGGIPEAIDNNVNGILVEPDPEKIAEKIDFLLQNYDLCNIISQNAQSTAENKFTWENSAKKFISLYREE